ncbi:MAG: copper homeostasis protein CutC [Bacteroidota bacterium]
MKKNIILEIVVDSLVSALAAQDGGAYRLEVCVNLAEGGLFPSAGLISEIRERVTIPIHVMIRPRPGNFVYSDTEYALMKDQILIARESGTDGVVFGMLDKKGDVDKRTKELVEVSSPLSVTFHRAFDEARNPMEALEAIIASGAHRLLTSGQKGTAWEGRELIRELGNKSGKRIGIIAGAGIDRENAMELVKLTGVREIHLARAVRNSGGIVEAEQVRKILNCLNPDL